MASTYKVLGQEILTAETMTDVYTVPSATQAVVSTIVICNLTSSANTFRLAIRPAGATLADKNYIAFEAPIAAYDSTTLTLGVTLDATDVITAYGGAASSLTVNIFGSEIT